MDDNLYITENSHVAHGLTVQNIIWAFSSFESFNWHPITWISHMLDVQFYGMNPRGHHLTNVAVHSASSVILFLFLFRFTGILWSSASVAALFALHPLRVESVAWVAERKDVLSAFFWFLTIFFYCEYVSKMKSTFYVFALFCMVLGLMAKPMLVTIPLVMVCIDFWPLNRFRCEQGQFRSQVTMLIMEKLPFFACSLLSGLITVYAQQKGGAVITLDAIPLGLRTQNAITAYVQYIVKTMWPNDLALFYPFPLSVPLWQVIASLFFLVLISVTAYRTRHHYPYIMAGWFWYLITLLPVIGFIQVGGQSMADRYTYIPTTGLFIIAAWGIPELTRGLRYWRFMCALSASICIVLLSAVTWRQLGYWKDNISLYQHSLQVTNDNYVIHNNMGVALAANGNTDAAIAEYRKALRIKPNYADAHYNMGIALVSKGGFDEAINRFQQVLQADPNHTDARNNLAVAFASKGEFELAIQEFKRLLQINPDCTDAHYNMGLAYAKNGNFDAAIQEYQEELLRNPKNDKAYRSLKIAHDLKKMSF